MEVYAVFEEILESALADTYNGANAHILQANLIKIAFVAMHAMVEISGQPMPKTAARIKKLEDVYVHELY